MDQLFSMLLSCSCLDSFLQGQSACSMTGIQCLTQFHSWSGVWSRSQNDRVFPHVFLHSGASSEHTILRVPKEQQKKLQVSLTLRLRNHPGSLPCINQRNRSDPREGKSILPIDRGISKEFVAIFNPPQYLTFTIYYLFK